MKRGLGYKPDRPDPRDRPLGALVRAASYPPASDVLKWAVAPPTDQEDAEGCVGWSLSGALWTRWSHLADARVARPSAMFPWWLGRSANGMANDNDGTYIRDAVKQVALLGICPESRWPSNPPTGLVDMTGAAIPDSEPGVPRFAMQPSVDAFQHAADQRFPLGYARVGELLTQRRAEFSLALSSGYPVVIGTQVTRAFLALGQHGPLPPPGPTDEIVGGHALQVATYDERGVYGPNSWGSGWGNGGWFAFSWAYVLWEMTEDCWAIDAALPGAWQ